MALHTISIRKVDVVVYSSGLAQKWKHVAHAGVEPIGVIYAEYMAVSLASGCLQVAGHNVIICLTVFSQSEGSWVECNNLPHCFQAVCRFLGGI